MVLKLALIRCGRTESDECGRLLGASDEPLSPGGRAEIKELARGGSQEAELVFTDETARCRETVSLLYPRTLTVIDRNLRPFSYGEFEGETLSRLQWDARFRSWAESKAASACPGGESPHMFSVRCSGVFRSIAGELSAKGIERAAVVTHGAVISAMLQSAVIPRSAYRNWEPMFGKGYLIELDSMSFMARILSEI